MADETIALALQITGQDQAKDMAEALKNLEALILKSVQAHKSFDAAMADPAIRQRLTDLKALQGQHAQLEKQLRATGGGMAGFGQSMLQTGRIVQDFQAAGLNGIVNNLEGMAQALGLGAGVAGAVTVAAVAFQVFGPQIKEFLATIGGTAVKEFTSQIEGLKKQIKELTDKPIKLEVDLQSLDEAKARLDLLTKGRDALNAAMGKQTSAEAESGKAIAEGFGATAADRALQGQMTDAQTAKNLKGEDVQAAEAQVAKYRGQAADLDQQAKAPGLDPRERQMLAIKADQAREAGKASQGELDKAKRQAREDAEGTVGNLIKQAQSGTGVDQSQAQAQLAIRLRDLDTPEGRAMAGYINQVGAGNIGETDATDAEMAELNSGVTSGKKTAAGFRKREAAQRALDKEGDEVAAAQRKKERDEEYDRSPAAAAQREAAERSAARERHRQEQLARQGMGDVGSARFREQAAAWAGNFLNGDVPGPTRPPGAAFQPGSGADHFMRAMQGRPGTTPTAVHVERMEKAAESFRRTAEQLPRIMKDLTVIQGS